MPVTTTNVPLLPPVTYGGFVGSAIVNPAYAVKVKNSDAVVDFRDFFSLPDNPQNSRRHAVSTTIRHFRQQDYTWQMMRDANIPMYDVLYLPNGFLSAAITKVKKHLIGTTDGSFGDVLKKVLKQMTIRVAYKVATAAGTWYTTKIIDPLRCKLRNQQGELIENWPQNKNCIEQNNLQLEVPEELLFDIAPEWMLPELKAYTAANGKNSVVLRIQINGKILKWLKKGWTAVKKAIPKIKEMIPVITEGVNLIKMIVGADGQVIANKVYHLHSIDDLMLRLNGQVSMRCISPMSRCLITPDLFPLFVSRNGYALNDLDIEWCTNFADLARREGFSSIDAMLNAARGANGSRTIWKAYPYITAGLRDMGVEDGALTAGKAALPDEVDYRTGVYPLADDDCLISSMDATGIGGKTSRSACWLYPKDGESAEEDDAPSIDFADEYSIGGSIPRTLGWELDPDFEASGGTMENVGTYLLHAEFEFSRINLYLDDEHGFRVPCSDASISVLNFDTSKPVESAVAILKIVAQGSTVLTAQFPYSVVEDEVKMMLSETTAPEVMIGSKILPQWLVNVVSNREQEEIGYKNLASLTTSGYTFDAPDMTEEGEYEVVVHPVGVENVSSAVRVVAKNLFEGLDADAVRNRYEFFGWLKDQEKRQQDQTVTPSDIEFVLIDKDTGAPVYYGSAADTHLIDSVLLNGQSLLTLVSGDNMFALITTIDGLTWTVSASLFHKIDHISFEWKPESRYKLQSPIAEPTLFGGDVTSITAEDFVCKLHWVTDPNDVGPRVLTPFVDYNIEARQPYVFAEGETVGKCYIRPIGIRDMYLPAPSVQLKSVDTAECFVKRANASTDIPLQGFDIRVANGYVPYAGMWLDLTQVTVTAIFGDSETGTTHEIPIDPSLLRWWVVRLDQPEIETTRFTQAGENIEVRAVLEVGGVAAVTASATLTVLEGELTDMTVKFKDGEPGTQTKPHKLPFGTPLTLDMFEIKGILNNPMHTEVDLGTDPFELNYDSTISGVQTCHVRYGRRADSGVAHIVDRLVYVNYELPVVTDLKIVPKTTRFAQNAEISGSDFDVTAITESGQEIDIPESEIVVTEFTSSGAANQTGMLTAQYPAEGAGVTGSIAAATCRYDVGAGGGSTEFNLPAVITEHTEPYCFKNEVTTKFGLERAHLLSPEGARTPVDPSLIDVDRVDTSVPGHVRVDVYLRESGWHSA